MQNQMILVSVPGCNVPGYEEERSAGAVCF